MLDRRPAANGWTTVLVSLNEDDPKEIAWPPGIRMTEEHLGKNWANFGKGVYTGFYDDLLRGEVNKAEKQDIRLEVPNKAPQDIELWILTMRGGIWWAATTEGRLGKRIMGCGFLATHGHNLIVQSAMIWRLADRKSGIYNVVLQRLREWIRPGTVFSDVCMSAQAVMSWHKAVASEAASWDIAEGRFRRNPRANPSRQGVRRGGRRVLVYRARMNPSRGARSWRR